MNPHEAAARAAKVAKLMGWLPVFESAEQNARVADRLAAFTPAERLAFALGAGVKPPSETTWSMLVERVRARRKAA